MQKMVEMCRAKCFGCLLGKKSFFWEKAWYNELIDFCKGLKLEDKRI